MVSSLKETLERMRDSYLNAPQEEIEARERAYEESQASIRRNNISFALDRSNIPAKQQNDIKDITPKNDKQKGLIKKLMSWSYGDKLPYVCGAHGTGKTFIASAFAYSKIQEGKTDAYFCAMSEFIINYRQFKTSADINTLLNPRILILDDFCSHNSTRHIVELLYTIIDYRNRHDKATLITSNVKPNEIAKYLHKTGESSGVSLNICNAIEDRIFELCEFVEGLNGTSIRLTSAIERAENNE